MHDAHNTSENTPGPSTIDLHVQNGRNSHNVEIHPDAPLSDLLSHLESLTSIPEELQKLIFKGKIVNTDPSNHGRSLNQLGITSTSKLTLLGPSPEQLSQLRRVENTARIRNANISKGAPKVRSTVAPITMEELNYRFHEVDILPNEPHEEKRREMLDNLAADPAVRDVMVKERFSVGLLGELHPHRDPTILGVNKNAGETIHLRLMTDDLTGLRSYNTIRRVLLHELAHNQFGPHDNDFKELNSKLNKMVVSFEAARNGGHTLSGEDAHPWEPAEERPNSSSSASGAFEGEGQRLGGDGNASWLERRRAERKNPTSTPSSNVNGGNNASPRERMLEAAMRRRTETGSSQAEDDNRT